MRLDKKLQPKPDEIKAKADASADDEKLAIKQAEAQQRKADMQARKEAYEARDAEKAGAGAAAAGAATGSKEDVKAKMREALDRKKANAHGAGEPGSGAKQKNHGVSGPVGPKRFQRKSGG